jgi:HlyD family secretion protein
MTVQQKRIAMKKYLIIAAMSGLISCLISCGGKNTWDASGVFEATEVTVSAQTSGILLSLDIDEGDSVTAEQPIGLVDTVQLHLRRQQALGSLSAAGARRLDVERQLAALRQQIATARREQSRFQSLVRENAATQKQLDDITSSLVTLERQLAAQTESITGANASLDGETSAMMAGMAVLDDQIARSTISSPRNGTIIAKYAEAGELVSPGRPLFRVADLNHIFLRAYITADQLNSLKLGEQVRVFADEGRKDRREYPGTVTWIADRAEFTPKTIQTRNERANLVYAIKISVPNDGLIKIGMYGEVVFN